MFLRIRCRISCSTSSLCAAFDVDVSALRGMVQDVLDEVGTDSTEQVCEAKCHEIILGGETALLHTLCTPICRS